MKRAAARHGRSRSPRRLALGLASLLVALVPAGPAFGQSGAATGVSVAVGTSDDDPAIDQTLVYGVRVTNGGQAALSGGVLQVVFPPSFRPDAPPAGCVILTQGMECNFGVLPAGQTLDFYFSGRFEGLDDGATIATVGSVSGAVQVTVERQDNEGDDSSGSQPAARSLTCPGGNVTLSGGSDPNETIGVDDDLQVFLNGKSIFNDDDEFAQDIPPIEFSEKQGNRLRVVASNSELFGGHEQIDPLYLHCDATGETQVLDPNGFEAAEGPPGEVFYDETFTIRFT